MANKYIVRMFGHSVEMTKPNSTMLVYKIPYQDIVMGRVGFNIPNRFVVYILFGRNSEGKDALYVGKSKNGIDSRPTAHNERYSSWLTCYVLTQFKERTFLNDGTIQYLEDRINKRINESGLYENKTRMTTSGTANTDDEEDCENYLGEVYEMLSILGLDLISDANVEEVDETDAGKYSTLRDYSQVPNGRYTFTRKLKRLGGRIVRGTMDVRDGQFILLAGSDIAQDVREHELTGAWLAHWREAKVENGVLLEDMVCSSPSECGSLIIGTSCNGWRNWRDSDGRKLDTYRTGNV